jgi:hypothetical protein
MASAKARPLSPMIAARCPARLTTGVPLCLAWDHRGRGVEDAAALAGGGDGAKTVAGGAGANEGTLG